MPPTPTPPKTKWQKYPTWITSPAGLDMIVKDHIHHSRVVGKPMNELGEEIQVDPDCPTTVELILKGYDPEAAEALAAQKRADAEKPKKRSRNKGEQEPYDEPLQTQTAAREASADPKQHRFN
jgi:hypothetical protein